MSDRAAHPFPRLALALLTLAGTASCAAHRTLTISSDPPGATVRIDDVLIGETPVVLPFHHYGTRRLTLYLEGHRTEAFDVAVEAPWYGRFPMDFVTEVLVPVGWRDDHPIHVDLVPGSDLRGLPVMRSVLERAEVLRRAGPEGPRRLPSSELERGATEETDGAPLR
jgi:hypothetical protein